MDNLWVVCTKITPNTLLVARVKKGVCRKLNYDDCRTSEFGAKRTRLSVDTDGRRNKANNFEANGLFREIDKLLQHLDDNDVDTFGTYACHKTRGRRGSGQKFNRDNHNFNIF